MFGKSDFNIILILVLLLGRRFLIFLFSTGRTCYFFFPFIIFPTETGAKNKRPQARPRAKESVMIPTLLMNIPNPHQPNNNTNKPTTLVCEWLWSFCEFFSYFICCSSTAAWETELLVAYIRMGIEVGGKTAFAWWWVHQQNTHRRRKKSGSGNALAFSRLVRSSPSFPLACLGE
jgi:hypothetical protein